MSEIIRYLIQKTPIGTMMKPNAEGNWIASEDFDRVTAERPAPVANTWPKLSFMAIAAGEHARADYCQKHAYSSLNEYRNHEALTHAIEVAVAYDKLNSKPAPVAVR